MNTSICRTCNTQLIQNLQHLFVSLHYAGSSGFLSSSIQSSNSLWALLLSSSPCSIGWKQFEADTGTVETRPFQGTHWIFYIRECYFDSYGKNKLSKFFENWYGCNLYSEYKLQGLKHRRDFFCAANCLFIIYTTEVWGLVFKSAVSNFY